jgi:hypothetical protein
MSSKQENQYEDKLSKSRKISFQNSFISYFKPKPLINFFLLIKKRLDRDFNQSWEIS